MMWQDIAFFFFAIFLMLLVGTVFMHMLFLVPYVPSKKRVVEKMIDAAKIKNHETVFDLGCGDGRLLLAAERKAAKKKVSIQGIGFEIAPLVYFLAWTRKIISRSSMVIKFQSFFSANLRKANVIFCYLLPNVMPRLAEKIKRECKPGTRIISNTFHIPGLKPKKIFAKDSRKGLPTIYVYEL